MKSEKQILKSTLFAAGIITAGSLGAADGNTNENPFGFDNLGTGGEFRSNVIEMNTIGSNALANARDAVKYAELSCGESTCGSKDKKADAKAEKKSSEATCGAKDEKKSSEAKCGAKDGKKADAKKEKKSSEAKCGGEAKCGSKDKKGEKKSESKSSESKCGESTCGGK